MTRAYITFKKILSQANITIDKLKGLFPRREGNFSTRFILAVIQVCACAFFLSFFLFICLFGFHIVFYLCLQETTSLIFLIAPAGISPRRRNPVEAL